MSPRLATTKPANGGIEPASWQAWLDARCQVPDDALGLRIALGLTPLPDWPPLPPPPPKESTP